MRNKKWVFSLLVLLDLLAKGSVWAQTPYPNHPVALVIPFAAGGDADQFGRALAKSVDKLSQTLTFVISNQVGKSGGVASLAVRNAPADGYTLMAGRVGTHAILPALDPSTPYKFGEFTTLAILELDPLICAVRANSAYHSARDLLTAIRTQPGALKFSTSGPGTILNFAALYLMSIAGLPDTAAVGVHFDGGMQAVEALVEGKVDFTCAVASTVASMVRNGKLRGLFTTAPGRMEAFPNVPNAREAGYRDMSNIVGWTALMAPAGLPDGVVQHWKQLLQKVAKDPEWLASNQRLGGQPAIRLIARPQQYVQEQYTFYQQLALTIKMPP